MATGHEGPDGGGRPLAAGRECDCGSWALMVTVAEERKGGHVAAGRETASGIRHSGEERNRLEVRGDPDGWAPPRSETQRECGGRMDWAGFDGPSIGFGLRRERREGEGMLGWVGLERDREEVLF